MGWCGQLASFNDSYDGPFHQSFCWASCVAGIPRDARSAGLSGPGVQFHLYPGKVVFSWISVLRLVVNVFNWDGVLPNHRRTVMESVQKLMVNISEKVDYNMSHTVRGEGWWEPWLVPLVFCFGLDIDVSSEKKCNVVCQFCWVPNHLGILMSMRLSSCRYCCHCWLRCVGTGSS